MEYPIILSDLLSDLYLRLTQNRTGRVVGGLAVDYLGNGVTQVLAILVTPLLISLLSSATYGFWIVITQVIFWLGLLDGGIGIYLIKAIANSKDKIAPSLLSESVSTCFWTYVFLALIVMCIGMSIAPFLPGWVKIEPDHYAAAMLTFQIAVVTAAVSLVIVATFYGILQGYQQIALVNAIIYSASIANLLLAVALIMLGFGIEAMAWAQLVTTLSGGVVAFFMARRLGSFSLSPRFFRLTELRKVFHYTFFFQMNKLSFLANTFSDGLLLAGYLGTASVTTYTMTQKLPQTASFFLTKVGGAMLPGLAELFAQNDYESLQRVFLRLMRLLLRFSLLALIFVLALNERFVGLWVGQGLFGGFLLSALFAYVMFFNAIIGNISTFFFSSGQLEGWGWLSVVSAVVKIGLTIILLPTLGLLAPVIGTVVGGSLLGLYTPIKISRLIRLNWKQLIRDGVLPVMIGSTPTVFIVLTLYILIPSSWRWLGLGIIALSGLLANTVVFDIQIWRQGYLRLKSYRAPSE